MHPWLYPPSESAHVGADPPISSSTVNAHLKPIAALEAAAEAASDEALAVAQQAAAANDGYSVAFAKIKTAANRWRDVRQLALKLEKLADGTEAAEQAKLAAPGILATVAAELQGLAGLAEELRADQAQHRPDLPPLPPPMSIYPDGGDGPGWGALAIAGGIVYLIYKAVF